MYLLRLRLLTTFTIVCCSVQCMPSIGWKASAADGGDKNDIKKVLSGLESLIS